MTPGIHPDIPEADYHTDPALSQSGAKDLLKAPALYQWRRAHPVTKPEYDFGHVAHKLVLGKGGDVVIVEAADWRTKDAQEQRRAAYTEGRIPILRSGYTRAERMAEKVQAHALAADLLSEGQAEVSVWATDPDTAVPIRGRLDWLNEHVGVDYKTSADADPWAWARSAAAYGYHVQAAWYEHLLALAGHPLDAFAFIVQDKQEPHLVSVVELDEESVEAGRRRMRRALQVYRDCTTTGRWPGYLADADFATVTLPRWALMEETP